jgi:hypothetical protein
MVDRSPQVSAARDSNSVEVSSGISDQLSRGTLSETARVRHSLCDNVQVFIEFTLWNTLVPALGLDSLKFSRVNPAFQSGIADSQYFRRVTRPDQLGTITHA